MQQTLSEIASSVVLITDRLNHGELLLHFGQVRSGSMGILDESECPQTFGKLPEMV